MIGNDIVDIAETQQNTNWQRPRFLEKLFTTEEQRIIHNSENPFIMVWRLWSMKETAYKLYTQLQASRFYNPKQFECEINDSQGKVRYKNFECDVRTKITPQYILSESSLESNTLITECLHINYSSSKIKSEIIKEVLLLKVAKQFNLLVDDLKIIKSEFGIPSIYHNSKKLNIGVSISHHGSYGAYAIST